ncbi:MAG: radical SAM protein [Deltaproteobacteria bacterium]|nr:radical SAM protein [Deltaproteobacteria bacterium]
MPEGSEALGGSPGPQHFLLELTKACNLRCVHCAVSSEGYVAESRPWAAFERLLPTLRRLRPSVELSGHGESLVYKRFFDAFTAVVDAGCPVSFITNATLLAPELSERMLAYAGPRGWSHVTVSVDAAEPEMFERLRRGARFEAVVSNLEALCEAKRRLGLEHPVVGFNTVLMRDNLDQLVGIVRLASRVGAASVTLVELLEYDHFSGHRLEELGVEFRRSLVSARAEAKGCGVHLDLVPGLKERLGETE